MIAKMTRCSLIFIELPINIENAQLSAQEKVYLLLQGCMLLQVDLLLALGMVENSSS
jgi:hypothetical protein